MKIYDKIANMKRLTLGERGAAAFLTVIVIALILTTVTLGFIRLMTSEQRQATDDELTKRAYYAAESGVEDAIRAIEKYLAGNDPAFATEADLEKFGCESAEGWNPGPPGEVPLSNDLDTAYTCQLISMRGTQYRATLAEGQSAVLKLDPVDPSAWDGRVRIHWHETKAATDGGNGPATLARVVNDKTLPQHDSWPGPVNANVAMLRTEFMDFSLPINTINNRAGFLNPPNGGTGIANVGSIDKQILDGACDAANEYACQITISGVGGLSSEKYLRLTPVYTNTNVMVELLDATGQPIEMQGAQATIDVTGRAGDVYRRVQKVIDLVSPGEVSNFALMADRICKRFYITNDVADFTDECNNIINGGSEGSVPTAGGSVAGNAAIGGYDDGGGSGGGSAEVRHWYRTWPNDSVYSDRNTIRGCKWEFIDTTTGAPHMANNIGAAPGEANPDSAVLDYSNSGPIPQCRSRNDGGQDVGHEFPIICTGAGNTFRRGDDPRRYTVRLTMYYTNGSSPIDEATAWLPRHNSATYHANPATLPCARARQP